MEQELKQLTDNEKILFEKLRTLTVEEIKRLLSEKDVRVDCLDSSGMTLLQHAAYVGNYDLCKLFLDYGANINVNYHEHKYTSLMFAALSGKIPVVSLMLENGASVTAVNSINRTASQMAAFIGNHDVVSLINNFIPREEIDSYTEIHGQEKEPKLPPLLGKPLHAFVIMININPVRLAMFLQKNMVLLEEKKKVAYVLDHLSGKQLNDNGNELLSMKLHHLSFIIKTCEKFLSEQKNASDNEKKSNLLDPLIKQWIKRGNDVGFPINLEKLMRQSILEYHFTDCPLYHQLIRTLGPVKPGDEPSAISMFSSVILGQRGLESSNVCLTCGEPKAEKKCSSCKSVYYCNQYCQKLHWFSHKVDCPRLNKERLEQEVKEKEKEKEESEKSENQVEKSENYKTNEITENKANEVIAENNKANEVTVENKKTNELLAEEEAKSS